MINKNNCIRRRKQGAIRKGAWLAPQFINRLKFRYNSIMISAITLFTLCLFMPFPNLACADEYNDPLGFETATEYLSRGMYLDALAIYKEIADYSKNRESKAKALLYMGSTYSLYLDRYEAALNKYDEITEKYPETDSAKEAVFNSGIAFYEKGELKKVC